MLGDMNRYSFCAGNYNDTGLTKLRFLINLTQTFCCHFDKFCCGDLMNNNDHMPAALEF